MPHAAVGKTLIEASVRQSYGITVLAIKRSTEGGKGPRQTIITTGQETLQDDDLLVVFGADESLDKLNG